MNREHLKGRWYIQTWEQIYDDGRVLLPMGRELEGFIEYSDHGMFCIISPQNRTLFQTGGQWSASDQEKANAYDSYLSYAGDFEVDGNTISHHVHYSIFPNWIGGVQHRQAILKGDLLELTTAKLEAGTSEARISKLTFSKSLCVMSKDSA